MPMTQVDFARARPIYQVFPGWDEDISKARTLADLPTNARAYIRGLEELSGSTISAVGVGPGRDETIVVRDLLR
jgi:adenylosuccinate synthase